MDFAKGMYASELVYSDKNLEQLDEVLDRPGQFHSGVYRLLEEADKQGYFPVLCILRSHSHVRL